MGKQTAMVLGASGSVGRALVKELIRDGTFHIITFVRQTLPEQAALAAAAGIDLREVVVKDMRPATLEAATALECQTLSIDGVGFSVLGVGAGTAKLTIDEHRAIDVHLNAAFARGLKSAGVQHLAIMSAVGANPHASTGGSGAAGMPRYARVKGELEEMAKELGPPVVSIFRPAMIVGSQHTPWLLEKILPLFAFITPKNYRSITTEQIARSMVAVARKRPTTSSIYHHSEMLAHDHRRQKVDTSR